MPALHPECKQAMIDTIHLSLAHIKCDELGVALMTATKLDLNPPRKVEELTLAVSGAKPEWGTAEQLSRDVAKSLHGNLSSHYWASGTKAALVIHSLLWRGGPEFVKAVAALEPAINPSIIPTYVLGGCGQGLKQQPTVRFIAGLDMMLTSTLTLLPHAATELRGFCKGKGVDLFRFPRVLTAFDMPTVSKALDVAAQLNAHIMYLVSATDLNLLVFDNPLSVEVVNRVIHDCKSIFYANYRIFEQIFAIEPSTAYLIPLQDRRAWTSLYQSFVGAALRLGVLFNDFRGLTISITEPLPPPEKKFDLPKKRMSEYWHSVNAAYEAAAAAAAAGISGMPMVMGALSASSAEPSNNNGKSSDSENVGMLRAETSPVNSNSSNPMNRTGEHGAASPDSFIEGALTEAEDESHSTSSTAVTFASYLESTSPERYVLGNVLGKGAFGVVYRAFDSEEGVFVAVKELQVAAGAEVVQRSLLELQAEFALLTKLSDPHVVAVQGFELIEGKPRIIMEWMPGGSIQAALKLTRNGFRESVVAKYMKQTLQGLAYLHAHNVVHRDIKPGNLLLSATGEVKLSDFGTSRLLSEVTDSMRTGSVVGTIPFLALECFTGNYSSGSDVWAVGCSALEMLTGRSPWSETNARDSLSLVFIIGNAKPPNHHPRLPDVHPDIEPSPLVFSSSGTMVRSNLGTGNGTISAIARDFLLQCFTYDAKVRPSASQLLQHPFILAAS